MSLISRSYASRLFCSRDDTQTQFVKEEIRYSSKTRSNRVKLRLYEAFFLLFPSTESTVKVIARCCETPCTGNDIGRLNSPLICTFRGVSIYILKVKERCTVIADIVLFHISLVCHWKEIT